MRNNLARLTAALLACGTVPSIASATVLTFDIDNTQPDNIIAMDQNYGDRVTATVQNNASYGVGSEGFTPDVTVSYAGRDAATGADYTSQLTRWTTDYGDLTNVLEDEADTNTINTITMSADPGHDVSLYGFDMAGWPNTDYTISNLSVLADGVVVFSQDNLLIQGDMDGPRHDSFVFDTPLVGSDLTIQITPGLGGDSDNIGIDNIRFGEGIPDVTPPGVPEPATWATMLGGFGLMGGALRRRARAPLSA